MSFQTNPQLDLAFEYLRNTNKNIFLTGKAGTGKTTFLHQLKAEQIKRMVVVAPTGVAAINAGGMTIHSFFQLPFGLFLPDTQRDPSQQRRFTREKINLIKSLDLVVIDEISMVRADVLDAIDEVLRRYRDHAKPFGGVQLLMIGDLHQLPPVVRDEEWEQLQHYYSTQYFFSSRALQRTVPIVIELKRIYRQSDTIFIDLLNKVRNNDMDESVLEILNSRYIPNFEPSIEQPYITLTSHNAVAQDINFEKLTQIAGVAQVFKADIKGDFPEKMYPNDEVLEFKMGAQVMFVKNEIGRERRYYNGKIGQITAIDKESITVKCPGDDATITVLPVDWQNLRFNLNEKTKEVTEEVLGTFKQLPLKLAWAITIHKSQGLTFDRAIIDAQSAFAHGQVYVALSRCKSFDGIVLRTKIAQSSIKTDTKVRHYSEEADRNIPDASHLQQSKKDYQQSLLMDLFALKSLRSLFDKGYSTLMQHETSLHGGAFAQFKAIDAVVQQDVFVTADRFRGHLVNYFQSPELPEDNPALQERVQKAGGWFADKLSDALIGIKSIPIETDNTALRKEVADHLTALFKETTILRACFGAMQKTFSTQEYLRVRANTDIDTSLAAPPFAAPSSKTVSAPPNTPNPALYHALKKWRDDTAETAGVVPYEVLTTKSMLEIVHSLPMTPKALAKIKGIGKVKLSQFGGDLIRLVQAYCSERKIISTLVVEELPPTPKLHTRDISLGLFKSGKTIDEIASERGMVRGTIETHLEYFIGDGSMDIAELVTPKKQAVIEEIFETDPAISLADAKLQLGDSFSYAEIRLVKQHMGKFKAF